MPVLFYYPKINAPRPVIDQALLYWDGLATVAPTGPVELSPALLLELYRRGLTRNLPRDRFGVELSAAVQLCLVSVASQDIARVAKGGGQNALYPHTDSLAAYRFAHTPVTRGTEDGHRLEVEIGGLLPVPGHEVTIESLIEFREHHDDPRDVLQAVKRELEDALADWEKAGRSARITWRRRVLTVSTALASAYAGQRLYPEAGWLLGVISGAAINIATSPARGSGADPAYDFSYLHRVRSALA